MLKPFIATSRVAREDAATVAPQGGERCDYRNPLYTPKGNHRNQLQRRPQRNRLIKPSELEDRKSTRLNSSHGYISYAVFCLKKKNNIINMHILQYKNRQVRYSH